MSQRVVHRLGFLLGFLLLAIGVFILVRHIHGLRDKYQNRVFTIRRLNVSYDKAPPPLLILVRAPGRIYVDESASVSVSASFPTLVAPTEFGGPGEFPPLAINLAAAGLTVEPEGWLRLHRGSGTQNLVGVWSVRASGPGSYLLVFNPKLEFSDQEYAAMKRLAEMEGRKNLDEMRRIEFDPRADIPLEVEQRWRSYLSAAWGPVVTFMGSLLTLPGIISFFKDRKREREQKKKQSSVFE